MMRVNMMNWKTFFEKHCTLSDEYNSPENTHGYEYSLKGKPVNLTVYGENILFHRDSVNFIQHLVEYKPTIQHHLYLHSTNGDEYYFECSDLVFEQMKIHGTWIVNLEVEDDGE